MTFRREIPGPVLAHALLQLTFLSLAPMLLLSEDRMVVALVSNPVGMGMIAAGLLHVMDHWLRLSTRHRPVRRTMKSARTPMSQKLARLTIDGTAIDDEHLQDVLILVPTYLGDVVSLPGRGIRDLARSRPETRRRPSSGRYRANAGDHALLLA